jgi:hypothetical protein
MLGSTPMATPLPPGPAGLPLIGSALDWIRDQPGFVVDAYRRYGEVVPFNFVNFRCILMFGADANRLILSDWPETFLTEPIFDLGGAAGWWAEACCSSMSPSTGSSGD